MPTTGSATSQPTATPPPSVTQAILLPRLWHLNRDLFIIAATRIHTKDAVTCTSRLLDVAQDLRLLSPFLQRAPHALALDLAALASRREHLNLDKWLYDAMGPTPSATTRLFLVHETTTTGVTMPMASSVREEPDTPAGFVQACLAFLLAKHQQPPQALHHPHHPSVIPLAPAVRMSFMAALRDSELGGRYLSPDNLTLLNELDATALTSGATGPASQPAAPLPPHDRVEPFPRDIEDEANAFYERVYARDMTVTDLVDHIARLKVSPHVRDRQVHACTVHNLLEELPFFHKYPREELALTATLYGAFIARDLLPSLVSHLLGYWPGLFIMYGNRRRCSWP